MSHRARKKKKKSQPFTRDLRHVTRRYPSIQQGIHGRVEGTDRGPSRQRQPIRRARSHRRISIETRTALRIPVYVTLEANIAMQRVDDLRGESTDVGGGHMGAFCDLEGVEGDEVDSVDVTPFEGREDVRVGFG